VVDQVLSIIAGTKGHLDKVPVNRVREWETDFHAFMREQKAEVRSALAKTLDLTDDLARKIDACVAEFQGQFAKKGAPSGKAA
jgi:F-type H+-transporting ATPase subunit alpha